MSCFAEFKLIHVCRIVVVLSGLLFFSTPCFADIIKDLKPIDGYVVMAGDDGFIIDLDEDDGIGVGDVFSVLGPGTELVHPVTQKVIGKLDEVKGVLRVVRIDKGFSHVRPIGDSAAIKRGDPIRRYSSLKAVFWDYDGNNRRLYDRLQNSLTSLKWQDYQTSQDNRPAQPAADKDNNDALFFVADKNMLEVRDARFDLIRSYSLDGAAVAVETEAALPAAKTVVAPLEKPQAATYQKTDEKKPAAVIRYGSAAGSAQLLDNTMMADMLRQTGRHMAAVTDGKKISVFNIEEKLELIAEGKISGYGQVLAVKWWQPDVAGPLYLAALAWTDDTIDSTLFVLENSHLKVVAGGLDSILGSFDLDNDGRPETLLSQEFEPENFFGRRLKEMYWHNSQLKQKNLAIELPYKFTVLGGQIADLTGDGKLEAAYVRNGTLWIYSGKKRLFVAPKQMGGSLSVLTYKVDPTLLDYRTTSVFFEITPVAVDVDGDGRRELLAISSDQAAIRAPGALSTIDESRIMVFNYENGSFVKGVLGEPVEAAIQGLDVDDRQVLFVVTDVGSPLGQGGASRLQALNIAL